jgi:SAM-dependent methyltransferase
VLDLGSGTGKLTRVLRGRFADVVAVEPDARMRRLDPGALEGHAEAIPLADGSVDGVFVGEAFHWFDWPLAVAEIARVLRPGGVLALVWNQPSGDPDPPELETLRAIAARYRPVELGPPGAAIVAEGRWRDAFGGAPFAALRTVAFEHERVLDREAIVAVTLSVSIYAALPEERRRALAAELRAALPEGTAWRTRLRAEVTWTRRD